jgi:hypothetical protein
MTRRIDSPRWRRVATLTVGLACLIFAGCWDYNKTFRNNQGQSLTGLKIIVSLDQPSTTFPGVGKWYHGNSPDSITNLGDGKLWELKWNDVIPPGGSIHVGWEFETSTGFKESFAGFTHIEQAAIQKQAGVRTATAAPGTYEFASVALDTYTTADHGLVLEVSIDPAAPTGVTVTNLEWVAIKSAVPLDNLIFGDPLFESLSWAKVPGTPFTLNPGSPPRIFDIPDDALVGMSYGLVRYVAADTKYGFGQEAVYQNPLVPDTASVPAEPTARWGLMALALAILTPTTAALLRSRRRNVRRR